MSQPRFLSPARARRLASGSFRDTQAHAVAGSQPRGGGLTLALIPREEYAALERCVYLNQASLGLVPRRSTKSMVDFIVDVAQYGNVRLSDATEERILDDLRESAAGLFEASLRSVAVVGGASEALGQLAILAGKAGGEVLLVATDFPSVTYPWLAAHERFGTVIRWVKDSPEQDLTTALVDGVRNVTTAVCFSAVQFATGSLVDVGEVVRRAHAVGARVIVDVTQMAGAMAVSQRSWSADALVCSGYKWLSTHGGVALLVAPTSCCRACRRSSAGRAPSIPSSSTPRRWRLQATRDGSNSQQLLTAPPPASAPRSSCCPESAWRRSPDMPERSRASW